MDSRRVLALGAVLVAVIAAAGLAFAGGGGAGDNGIEHSFDMGNLDRSCKPCDDFFEFSEGGWLKNNPIPAAYPEWGSFITLEDHNENALHAILESAKKSGAAEGSNEQKIGDYYASCMDLPGIEKQGTAPLSSDLQMIDGVRDLGSLVATAAHLQLEGVGVLFNFGANQDFKDSTQVIGAASQGGLGLPDRDYYTRQDEESKQLREKYVKHVAKLLNLLGDDAAKSEEEARAILAVETTLAKASLTQVELREPKNVYHKMSVGEAQKLTPHLKWDAFFTAIGGPKLEEMNVAEPDFFKVLDRAMATVPLSTWKTYYRWQLADRSARLMSDAFVQENFDFNGRVLSGTKELRARWRRCSAATDGDLGEVLGQVYVQKYFPPESKAHALEMVHNLLTALQEDLKTLEWMSPATRQAAAEKLQAFALKIGYPDKWRDYSALKIDRSSYLQNAFRASEFEAARELAKIGKPVDRTEWGMTPPTVNAYYNPQLNEIVFPAGILQPDFYDPKRDDAYNYGAIGAVIGHEITHGFDDQGAQFDPLGNLKNWWQPEDLKAFQARGDCVAKQFDGYEVEKGLHENGKLVEGESIADLGGLKIAYAAMEKAFEGKSHEPDADGFTPEQRFFLGYSMVWAVNERPESARLQTNSDPHPLSKFRVNGPLSNLEEFAKAFQCQKGEAMVRGEVCRIW
jgi:putative endopeptidase